MSQIKRTLKEWEEIKGIEIIDYDGFDRTDEDLMFKLFTEEEFNHGQIFCTQYINAEKVKDSLKLLESKEKDILEKEIQRLKIENANIRKANLTFQKYIKELKDREDKLTKAIENIKKTIANIE